MQIVGQNINIDDSFTSTTWDDNIQVSNLHYPPINPPQSIHLPKQTSVYLPVHLLICSLTN